ncbi:hypothetical protein X777_16203, partial [Ooceraea biroi]
IIRDFMTSQVGNGESINADEAALELCKLREAAKLAAIYHSDERKFQRRTDLSHVVHATLHCVQFAITSAIEIFHHVHHYVNQRAREKDSSSPPLPEERNPIFFVYPICMLVSLVFAILWLVKKIVHDTPVIPFVVCATAAVLMLVTGIMEMKHADIYIDVTEFTDEEILEHPVFIHNFVMCILSIFVMTIYLIQAWLLLDQWMWVRKRKIKIIDRLQTIDNISEKKSDSDVSENFIAREKQETGNDEFEQYLAPIPTLKDLSVSTLVVNSTAQDLDHKPTIYCCFVDWYNYGKLKAQSKSKHEFQVVHIL